MIRSALVTLDYPPERGGVARYLGGLVHASEGAIDVFVNATHQSSGPGHVEPVQLVRKEWPQWWPMVSFMRRLSARGYGFVLTSHALPVGTAAWIAHMMGGPPYAVLLHGLDLRLAVSSARKAWLLRRILRGAKLVLTNSEFTAQEVRAFDGTVRPQTLTPGIDPIAFPPREEARRELGVSADAFVILTVARLIPRKGIDKLVKALAELPEHVRLIVVGDGTDRKRLENLAGFTLHVSRFTFIPHATDHERNRWYAAADIFALPVRDEGADVEGFGIVYLEAALAGMPVVAGRSGGAGEAVVDGKTGLLVAPESVEEIADAVRRLMSDPDLRARLGASGRERALKEFRWEERWKILRSRLIAH